MEGKNWILCGIVFMLLALCLVAAAELVIAWKRREGKK